MVLADVDERALGAAADELRAQGHRVLGVACDVADEDQVAALVDRTVTEFGRLDMAWKRYADPTAATPLFLALLAMFSSAACGGADEDVVPAAAC